MDRAMTLRMSEKMIKKDLESEFTFEDFKTIADNEKVIASNEDVEVYTKSLVLCFLFRNFEYYKIEDYIITFGTNIVSLCNSRDWYNGLSKIIQGSLEDLLIDISRRVELEIFAHLYEALELFFKRPEIFEESLKVYLTKNICEVEKVATLDAAESYKYEQISIPGVPLKKKNERANDLFSRTNYTRKESIRKTLRKYVIKNYDEDAFTDFIEAFNKIIDGLEIDKFSIIQIKTKYKEAIENLYKYVSPIWLEEQEKKDQNQLTLFDFIG